MRSDEYTSTDKQKKRMELNIMIDCIAGYMKGFNQSLMEGHNLEHNKCQNSIYSLINFLFCRDLKEHYKQKKSHGFNQIEI